MAEIVVSGGQRLNGEIPVSGAKNAALPLMAVTLLTSEPVTLTNCPDLYDIGTLTNVLRGHGAEIDASRIGEGAGSGLPVLHMHHARNQIHRCTLRPRKPNARLDTGAWPFASPRRQSRSEPARWLRHWFTPG